MTKNKLMNFFSALGRSLMMPIAALAAAGIFLGLTSALMKPQVVEVFGFLGNQYVVYFLKTFNSISGVVFNLIPVLFAITIASGLADDDKEVAAFAGFVGYFTFLVSASALLNSGLVEFGNLRIASILGVETLDMGAVAGIITGLIVAFIHNKYRTVEFPVAIAFYGGKRFVAIAVIIVMGLVGQFAPFVWSPVSDAITLLGSFISSIGAFGVFLFGFLERLLIPTGLHHVLNSIFRTTAVGGQFQGVEGSLNIFLQFVDSVDMAQLAPYTRFLAQGKFPFMLFGLPSAALAIYRTTPKDKQAGVKALLIAAVAATFVSGITEPLEFAFMFIAPVLFLFHSIMAGISFMMMSVLGVVIGNTGGGLIDFIIWGVMHPGSNWIRVILVGVPFSIVYYYAFSFYFKKKNLVLDVSEEENIETNLEGTAGSSLGSLIVDGLGGVANIVTVNNCISRLRVDIIDPNLINEDKLKKSGSMGIIKPSELHIHVVYGPKIDSIAKLVKEEIIYQKK